MIKNKLNEIRGAGIEKLYAYLWDYEEERRKAGL